MAFFLCPLATHAQVQVSCSGVVDSSYFSNYFCSSDKAVPPDTANNIEIREQDKPLVIKPFQVVNSPYGGTRSFQGIIFYNNLGELFNLTQDAKAPSGLVSILATNYGQKTDYQIKLQGHAEDNRYQINQTTFDVTKASVAKIFRNSVQVRTQNIGQDGKTITYSFSDLVGEIGSDRILLQIFDQSTLNQPGVKPTFEKMFDQSSKNASDLYLLGDVFGKVDVDVSGLVGQKGKTADSLCVDKVSSGVFNDPNSDDLIRRFFNQNQSQYCTASASDGSTTCHCTSDLLKKIAEYAPSQFCPDGYKYLDAFDDQPFVSLSVVRRKFKKRCTRSGVGETCTFSGKINACDIVTKTDPAFPVNSELLSAFSSKFGKLMRKNEIVSAGADPSIKTYQATFLLPSSVPGFATQGSNSQNVVSADTACAPYLDAVGDVEFLQHDKTGSSADQTVIKNWSFAQGDEISDFQQTVDKITTCADAAMNLGVAGYQNLNVQENGSSPFYEERYVDIGEACPAGFTATGTNQDYPESNIVEYHKYSDELLNCSSQDQGCPDATLNRSFKTYYGSVLQREAGQKGSFGGKAYFFIYDADKINVNYQNGANGDFTLDSLPQAPTKKYCAQVLDNALEKETLPYSAAERKNPVINLLTVNFYPFQVLDPKSLPASNFPDRRASEAVFTYKKMDSSVRDFIFKAIISKQDLSN